MARDAVADGVPEHWRRVLPHTDGPHTARLTTPLGGHGHRGGAVDLPVGGRGTGGVADAAQLNEGVMLAAEQHSLRLQMIAGRMQAGCCALVLVPCCVCANQGLAAR